MKKMSKCAAKAVDRCQKFCGLRFQHEGIVPQPHPNSQKKHRMHFPLLLFPLDLNHIQIELPIFVRFHRH